MFTWIRLGFLIIWIYFLFANMGKRVKKRKQGDTSPSLDMDPSQVDKNITCCICKLHVDVDEYKPIQCAICESYFHDECLNFDADNAEVLRGIFRYVSWVCAPCIVRARVAKNLKDTNQPESSFTDASALAFKHLETEIVELKSSCSVLVDEVFLMKETLDGILSNKPVLRQPPPSHQSHPAMPGQSSQTSRPSYARIASGLVVNNVDDPPLTARSMLKSVHTEIHEKERRKHYVIINGLKRDRTSKIQDDISNFVDICYRYLEFDDMDDHIVPARCRRLGSFIAGKIQPLLISFDSPRIPEQLLYVAKDLRLANDDYISQNIYIGADLTPAEAELAFERRQQRRARSERRAGTNNSNVLHAPQAPRASASEVNPAVIDQVMNIDPVQSDGDSAAAWLGVDPYPPAVLTTSFPDCLSDPVVFSIVDEIVDEIVMPSIIICQPLVSQHQDNLFADLGINLHNPPIIQTDFDAIFVSFNARSICNKLNEFNAFIDTVKPKYVAITETWLNNSVPDSLIDQINQYSIFRHDRPTGNGNPSRGGGVCLMVSNQFRWLQIEVVIDVIGVDIVCVDMFKKKWNNQNDSLLQVDVTI